MAKANWVNLSKEEGSGNATIDVSANIHTGRNPRTTQLTWVGSGVQDQVRTVIQQGSPTDIGRWPEESSADYTGATLKVSGYTNAEKLRFVLGEGDLDITLPFFLTAAGQTFSIGNFIQDLTNPVSTDLILIPGDPGATSAYEFSLDIKVPANSGEKELQRQLIVYGSSNNIFAICTIKSSNNNPYIEVPEGDILLSYTGAKKSIQIQSNTSWQIK